MIRVKICGITNLKDALHALRCGADALGFNFYSKSPRYIDKDRAREIIDALPPLYAAVGLFVNADTEMVREVADLCRLSAVQLHGDESPEYCSAVGRPVIKAIRVKDELSLSRMADYKASAFLLDSYNEELYGGTGMTFYWDLAGEASRYGLIILAGGLTPDNVEEAVRKVRPYGVDVCSGVEKEPGKKDPERVRRFMEKCRMFR